MRLVLPVLALFLMLPVPAAVSAQNPGGVVLDSCYECDPTLEAAMYNGSDHASIMDARDELVSRLAGNDAVGKLSTICSSHVDYNWNPVNSN